MEFGKAKYVFGEIFHALICISKCKKNMHSFIAIQFLFGFAMEEILVYTVFSLIQACLLIKA